MNPGSGSSDWTRLAAAILMILAVTGCGGGTAPTVATTAPAAVNPGPTTRTLSVELVNATGKPIEGAIVSLTVGGTPRQATTGANGSAVFADLPTGPAILSASAAGFESLTVPINQHTLFTYHTLTALRDWSVGRAIVLGTRMVERASDGSAMTVSVDIAVIDENSEAIQTLTAADFSEIGADCLWWGGDRDCASDSAGQPTTADGGSFAADGGAQFFGLQPPVARRPYVVGVLAERSTAVTDWEQRGPALKSFFAGLGGNDTASLASVQTEGGSATLRVLGLFTSNGRSYLDAIDQLAQPAGSAPAILDSLTETIRRTAAARDGGNLGAEATVLVMATPLMTASEIDAATALARRLGVRISTVLSANHGLPEMAVRTGGFIAAVNDPRQIGMVFGAMDRLLAGTTPYYRMQFRLKGLTGTFVPGGNAMVGFRVQVPSPIPNSGVYAALHVAIP